MRFTRFGLWSSAALVSTVLLASADARAQAGASVLTGRVTDASTKTPVPDVVVTVTSPALQGEETAVTDANGLFRVQNLPPGEYTIRLDKETYRPYARGGVALRADVTLRLDAELLPESLKEEITVVAENPTVDVGSSNTGLNITNDFARRVPLVRPGSAQGGAVRSFEAAAQAAPQATEDHYGTSINGTTSPENSYVIDGLSRNSSAYGVNGARLSMEFVKEVNVLTGGYMPEYGGGGGGILSAVTKSGSNEFHGGGWLFYSPGALEGQRKRVFRTDTIQTNPSLDMIGDLGGEVGGPIIKDKLWFYAGFLLARTSYNEDREFANTRIGLIPGSTQRYQALREDAQFFGKLTYAADKRNRFTLTAYTLPSRSGGSNRMMIDPLLGLPTTINQGSVIAGPPSAQFGTVNTNTTSLQVDWDTETPSKKVLLKTSAGWMHQVEDIGANDDTFAGDRFGLAATPQVAWRRNTPGFHGLEDFEPVPPWYCQSGNPADPTLCPLTGYLSGGPGFLQSRTADRLQLRSVLTLLLQGLGHHVVKVGAEAEYAQYVDQRAYSGANLYRESTSGGSFTDFRNYSYLTAPDERVLLNDLHHKVHTTILGGFLQDSWAIFDKVTLNAGVRYDAQLLYGDDGALTISLPNMISPRAGLVWDPSQKGRSKIYGNYARYYQTAPLNIMDRAGSSEPQAIASRSAAVCDPRDPVQLKGSCADPANFSNIGGPETPDKKYALIGAGKTPVDPDLKPQYSEEIVGGAEYDIIKNGRVGVSYTRRWMGRVIEDVSRDEAVTYFITNPGEGATRDFPKPERTYDAGTFFLQKTFGDNWEALASYTLAYLRGNWAGLYRPETDQLDPLTNSDFDLKSLTVNRNGPLPGDTRHTIKIFGSKTTDLTEKNSLLVGGGFRATSGGPTSYLGSHPIYGADEIFILPRGAGNRLPWTYSVDTSFGLTTKLGKDQTLTFSIDVFNLLNFQEIAGRDERYTSSDVNPIPNGKRSDLGQLRKSDTGELLQKREVNPNFSNPTSYQAPRQVRLGIRGTF
jgi:outer membrane receptor protein involved in Fe transport